MRPEAALLLASLVLAGCARHGAAPPAAVDAGTPLTGMAVFLEDRAVFLWTNAHSSVMVTLPGKDLQQAKTSSPVEGIAVMVDGRLFQLLDIDRRVVTERPAGDRDLLSQHRRWETAYFNQMAHASVESAEDGWLPTACGEALLWEIAWPDDLRAAHHATTLSQLYLTFVVEGRIVTVSSPVMEGQSVAERRQYLEAVARNVQVLPPLDQDELKRRLKLGEPLPT